MKRRVAVVLTALIAMTLGPLVVDGASAAPGSTRSSRLCVANGLLDVGYCLPSLR